MKKSLIILILLSFSTSYGISQSSDIEYAKHWQSKYWYYRYRLITDFMVRGSTTECATAVGYSIPAEKIGDPTTNKNIKWGDATSYLGHYIAVLATEYSLLKKYNQSVDKTLEELYDAMMAYERLDRSAEKLFFPGYGDCTVNGFFCRDDVDKKLFNDRNSPFNKKYAFTSINGLNVDTFGSDYYDPALKFPSQDQVAYLFMGFALVNKCLEGVSYHDEPNFFKNNAQLYTNNIIKWIEKCDWDGLGPDGNHYDSSNSFKQGSQWGIVQAAYAISGELYDDISHYEMDFPIDKKLNINLHISVNGDFKQLATAAWNTLGNVKSPACPFYLVKDLLPEGMENLSIGELIMGSMYRNGKDYSTSLVQAYAAIGNSWKFGLVPTCKIRQIPMPFKKQISNIFGKKYTEVKTCTYTVSIPGCIIPTPNVPVPEGINPDLLDDDITDLALAKFGIMFNQQIYYLLHRFLHDQQSNKSYIDKETFINILNSAPCDLPRYKPYFDPSGRLQNSEGKEGWWACNRWVYPQTASRQTDFKGKPLDPSYHFGIFNGLDYMLLYNLYNLTYGSASIQNTFDKTITIPISSDLQVLNDLTLLNTITGNDIAIQAGNSVTLKNGTFIPSGNVVDIKCASYDPSADCFYLKSQPVIPDENLERAAIDTNFSTRITTKVEDMTIVADSIRQSRAYIPIDASYLNSSSLKSAKVSASNALLSGSDKINISSGIVSDKVSIYPNPATDEINIMITLLKDDEVRVSIFDMSGRLLKVWNNAYTQGYQKIKLPLGQIGNGIYNMRVETSGYCVNQKVVIKKN
jgi:hypothetical protein